MRTRDKDKVLRELWNECLEESFPDQIPDYEDWVRQTDDMIQLTLDRQGYERDYWRPSA